MLSRLAHFIARHRWPVIGVWIVLTLIGGVAAGKLSSRWYQSFSIPGKPAYEASQRELHAFGVGVRPPNVVVFHTKGDATKSAAIQAGMKRAAATMPGSLTSSYFSTHSSMYVSKDKHTTFLEVYPRGTPKFDTKSHANEMRTAAARRLAGGITVNVTGHDPLEEASTHGTSGSSSVLLEGVIGGLGAIVILLFVFGTLPAVLMPIVVAIAAILNTFTLVWALTYLTNVSIIVQFLIALVGLGVSIDYALLMIFRFRDELREGNDVESSLVETMTHAGRSVIVSGDDRCSGAGVDDHPAAAVHPLDRDRRHADPGGVGTRGDHTAAGSARDARHAHQQPPRDAEAVRRSRPPGGRSAGDAGRAS